MSENFLNVKLGVGARLCKKLLAEILSCLDVSDLRATAFWFWDVALPAETFVECLWLSSHSKDVCWWSIRSPRLFLSWILNCISEPPGGLTHVISQANGAFIFSVFRMNHLGKKNEVFRCKPVCWFLAAYSRRGETQCSFPRPCNSAPAFHAQKTALDGNHLMVADEFGVRRSCRKQNRDYPSRITNQYSLSSLIQSANACSCLLYARRRVPETPWWGKHSGPSLSGVRAHLGRQMFIKAVEERTEMGNINQKGMRQSRLGSGFRRKCYKMRFKVISRRRREETGRRPRRM